MATSLVLVLGASEGPTSPIKTFLADPSNSQHKLASKPWKQLCVPSFSTTGTPRKINCWNLRIRAPWKRKIIFQSIIFRFYVKFQGSIFNQIIPNHSPYQQEWSNLQTLEYPYTNHQVVLIKFRSFQSLKSGIAFPKRIHSSQKCPKMPRKKIPQLSGFTPRHLALEIVVTFTAKTQNWNHEPHLRGPRSCWWSKKHGKHYATIWYIYILWLELSDRNDCWNWKLAKK